MHLNKPRSCVQFKRILFANEARKAHLEAHKRIFKISAIMK